MPNKLSPEDRDNLFIGGASVLGFSGGWRRGFRSGVHGYVNKWDKLVPQMPARDINTRHIVNWGRIAGLRLALPAALLFGTGAKLCTMVRDCSGLKSTETLSDLTIPPRP